MALNANALTSVADLKIQLDIPSGDTSQDSFLERLINTASDMIERYCNRVFRSLSRTEYYDGTGHNELILSSRPATSVTNVWVDSGRVFGAESLLASTDYCIIDGFLLRRHNARWTKDSQSIKITYTAGFSTLPSDITYACLLLCEWLYRLKQNRDLGRSSVSKMNESVNSYSSNWPELIKQILSAYVLEFVPGVVSFSS